MILGIIAALFLFFSLCIAASDYDDIAFPFALTFRANGITASRCNPAGGVETWSYTAILDKYNAYSDNAINSHRKRVRADRSEYILQDGKRVAAPPDTHDDDAVTIMLRDEVNYVSWSTMEVLMMDFDPKYAALFFSAFFDDASILAANRAVFPKGEQIKEGRKVGLAAEAASYAYGLHHCENLGQTAAECATNTDSFVLVIEYEDQYLHLNMIKPERDVPIFSSLYDDLHRELGAKSRALAIKVSSVSAFIQRSKHALF